MSGLVSVVANEPSYATAYWYYLTNSNQHFQLLKCHAIEVYLGY